MVVVGDSPPSPEFPVPLFSPTPASLDRSPAKSEHILSIIRINHARFSPIVLHHNAQSIQTAGSSHVLEISLPNQQSVAVAAASVQKHQKPCSVVDVWAVFHLHRCFEPSPSPSLITFAAAQSSFTLSFTCSPPGTILGIPSSLRAIVAAATRCPPPASALSSSSLRVDRRPSGGQGLLIASIISTGIASTR